MKFFRRKRFIIPAIIIVLLFILLFFLSSILRYWLEKNSYDLIGRKVELKELHINYLKFSVQALDFKMYEKDTASTFVSFDELYVDFEPWHLFSSEYAFAEIKLVSPYVVLSYDTSGFNFDDLLEGDTAVAQVDTIESVSDTVQYVLKNISLTGGRIVYRDMEAGTEVDMKNLGLKVPLVSWNSKKSDLGLGFTLGEKGQINIDGSINAREATYTVHLNTKDIDLHPFENYIRPYLLFGSFNGLLYSDIVLNGSMDNPDNMIVTGSAGLSEIVLTAPDHKPLFKADAVDVDIDTLDVGRSHYTIRKIKLQTPNIVAELLPTGTNFDALFAPEEPGDTLKTEDEGSDTTALYYAIDTIDIFNGYVAFEDKTLNRRFVYDFTDMDVQIRNYNDFSKAVGATFSVGLNKKGVFEGEATLDMTNTDNMSFKGSIRGMDLLSFSPYSEFYLARPIKKGTFNYVLSLQMNPKKLTNHNSIKIQNLEFGKKTKDTSAYKVPVNLALYILKDRKGMIDIDLPVEGNPQAPDFKVRRIIWKTLENFLIKTATQPFATLGKLAGTDPESIKNIPFDFLQDTLEAKQTIKLDKLASIMKDKPELVFTFIQSTDPDREKEMLAVLEAKKKYSTQQRATSPDIAALRPQDIADDNPAFVMFVNNAIPGDSLTLYDKCRALTPSTQLETLLDKMLTARGEAVYKYFVNTHKILPTQVLFKIADLRNLPEEMKKAGFTIEVGL